MDDSALLPRISEVATKVGLTQEEEASLHSIMRHVALSLMFELSPREKEYLRWVLEQPEEPGYRKASPFHEVIARDRRETAEFQLTLFKPRNILTFGGGPFSMARTTVGPWGGKPEKMNEFLRAWLS